MYHLLSFLIFCCGVYTQMDEVEKMALNDLSESWDLQWVDTYECPGGHREEGETILETAKRELWEETGASQFNLEKICVYSVIRDCEETFGMLYFANIEIFGELPMMEIEKIELFDGLPEKWTYPLIQPKLIEKIQAVIFKDAPL